MEWSITRIRLELKYTWKISRNASEYKENCIVKCVYQGYEGLGEAAPNIRYDETPERLEKAFESICGRLTEASENPNEFASWLKGQHIPKALKFAIESAFLHAWCKAMNMSVQQYLGINTPTGVPTCYTLPIMDPADIPAFYKQYNLQRFPYLKVKVNDADALDMVKMVHLQGNQALMIDANEAWKNPDELLGFIPLLKNIPILFIEQPLPAAMDDAYIYLKQHTTLPIMGDESVLDNPDFDKLEKQFHGINMKLMKAGGYINGKRILDEARNRNMITMIGCMVETTLGISSAWNLGSMVQYADLDGCLIVANDPYNMLKEENGTFYKC